MATIYPEHQRFHRPESEAERRLYPLLAALPDDYTVFCNRAWHVRPGGRGMPKPAEADFLIAHPDRGILVLEVKGGVIRHEPANDRWFSNETEIDPGPFEQVQRIRYLLAELLSQSGSREIAFPLGEAVAFPDGFVTRAQLPVALLPERVIGAEDLEDLPGAIERCFAAAGLTPGASFGPRGVRALREAVAGGVRIERHIGRQISDAEAALIELTEEQYEVLDQIDGNLRVCVMGGAGTGKTLLAIEQAKRLAARGQRVLLTCFNGPLGAHIRSQIGGDTDIEVQHFHNLCRVWASRAGLDHDQRAGEDEQDYWDLRLPGLLTEAAEALEDRYDAVLIDEAQDFREEWLIALELLLADERNGLMHLFADVNQAIYRQAFGVPEGFARFNLTKNLRNTANIHGLLARHFGETTKAKAPAGIDVQLIAHGDTADLRSELSGLLTRLTDSGVKPEDIVLLTGKGAATTALAKHRNEPLGVFRLTGRPSHANDIRFESVHRFKGLESPVVIICEMGDLRPEARRKVWYTGLSRARAGLFVLCRAEPGEQLDDVIERMAAEGELDPV